MHAGAALRRRGRQDQAADERWAGQCDLLGEETPD